MPKYTLVLRDSFTISVEAFGVIPDSGNIVFIDENRQPVSIYKDFVSVTLDTE